MIQALRRWWQQPDHYYFITASLAAHGLQSGTCRFIGAIVVARGFLPSVMLWSPAGPQGRLNQVISVIVAASSLLVALCWQRTPVAEQDQSLTCAGVLAAGIAASVLTRSNPVSGVVAGMAFAALAGYIVFFHTARYLILMLVVAAATILVPVSAGGRGGRCGVGGLPAGDVRHRDPRGGDLEPGAGRTYWVSRSSLPISSPSRGCSTAARSTMRRARCAHPAAGSATGIWR